MATTINGGREETNAAVNAEQPKTLQVVTRTLGNVTNQ